MSAPGRPQTARPAARRTENPPMSVRRRLAAVALAAVTGLVAGCASSPPAQWYQLPIDAPESATASATAASAPVWELSNRITLPGALDRDTLLVVLPSGEVQPLTGHRWAEPLRDSVPRVLRSDLERLRGRGSVWLAPLPAGLTAQRQLRVEVLALQTDPGRSRLRLLARWWLADGNTAPLAQEADLSVGVSGSSADALVAAHRQVLWQLARRIAAAP